MNIITYLLPVLVSCGWYGMLTAKRHKTLSMHLLALVSLTSGIYFLADVVALLATKDYDSSALVYASLTQDVVGPLLPLAAICYFIFHIKLEQHASLRWLLVLLPFACYSFLAFIATQGLGFDKAEDYLANHHMLPGGLLPDEIFAYKTYEFVVFEIFRWLMVASFSCLIVVIIVYLALSDFTPKVIYRFLFKGGPLRPSQLVACCFFFLMLQSYFRYSNTGKWMIQLDETFAWTTYIVKAITLFFIGLFGYHGQKPAIYLANKHLTPAFDDMPVLKPLSNWRDESGEDEYSLPILQSEFFELMRDKQCYRRPGLNIYSVSSELGVTANALNHMIKSIYGVNYNTYVKVQRVEFARRYHKAYPQIPAETVAMESGFRSANIMRQHFKEAAYVIQKMN